MTQKEIFTECSGFFHTVTVMMTRAQTMSKRCLFTYKLQKKKENCEIYLQIKIEHKTIHLRNIRNNKKEKDKKQRKKKRKKKKHF